MKSGTLPKTQQSFKLTEQTLVSVHTCYTKNATFDYLIELSMLRREMEITKETPPTRCTLQIPSPRSITSGKFHYSNVSAITVRWVSLFGWNE